MESITSYKPLSFFDAMKKAEIAAKRDGRLRFVYLESPALGYNIGLKKKDNCTCVSASGGARDIINGVWS